MYSVMSSMAHICSASHQAFSAAANADCISISSCSNLSLAMDARGTFLPRLSQLAEVVAQLQKVRAETVGA